MNICLPSVLFLAICFHGFAQELVADRSMRGAYERGTRSLTGQPGQRYWQNRGDYDIDVTFEPTTRLVNGVVHITYYNNSPDTLSKLLFKLYPNLYKSDAMRNTVIAPDDLNEGVQIHMMTVDGKNIHPKERDIRGTNMHVKGVRVLPHQQLSVDISYDYVLNKGSFNRTGQIDTASFFIAYFFPRLAVYDDVDGWNEYPYTGKDEFYNDYGDFNVSVTVPRSHHVWATGNLMNASDIYEPEYVQRILRAESEDGVVDVITREDLKNAQITKPNVTHTWKFQAKQVTDFAFALSSTYVWKASGLIVDHQSGRRARVDAVYSPDHKAFDPVVGYTRRSVELISQRFPAIPFPYSHMTVVDGLDAMEYPMMVNCLPFEDKKDMLEFTAHEVFHSVFPFLVGTNETKYAFMDEGLATMVEFMFHPLIDSSIPVDYDLSPVNDYAGIAEDMPVMTPTAQLYGKARYADKDLKPALALYYLREMLGDQLFTDCIRKFIEAWKDKHPTPYDFFYSMNRAAGVNLDWYWNKWWFEVAIPDLTISNVTRRSHYVDVTVTNTGGAPVPLHLKLHLKNGETKLLTRTIAVWKTGVRSETIRYRSTSEVTGITLGDAFDADVNPSDNVWRADKP